MNVVGGVSSGYFPTATFLQIFVATSRDTVNPPKYYSRRGRSKTYFPNVKTIQFRGSYTVVPFPINSIRSDCGVHCLTYGYDRTLAKFEFY